MAKSIPSGLIVAYDDGGGAPVIITQYVQTINGVDIESILEECHSFGDSWEEHLPVGIGKVAAIELGGLYDDTAVSGPNALFAGRIPETPASITRTLTLTWVGAKTTAFETYLLGYKRMPDRTKLTQYTVRLQPTGVVTET